MTELPKRMSTSVKTYTLNLVSALRTINSVHDELFYTAGIEISTGRAPETYIAS